MSSSLTSIRSAPTRRMTDSGSGKICTTSVRRLSSRLSRSMGFLDQILVQWMGWEGRVGEQVVRHRLKSFGHLWGRPWGADRRRCGAGSGRPRHRIGRRSWRSTPRSAAVGSGWPPRAGCASRGRDSSASRSPAGPEDLSDRRGQRRVGPDEGVGELGQGRLAIGHRCEPSLCRSLGSSHGGPPTWRTCSYTTKWDSPIRHALMNAGNLVCFIGRSDVTGYRK